MSRKLRLDAELVRRGLARSRDQAADLIAAGMPVELGDRDMIVPIITLADDEDTVARFTDTLVAIIERHRGPPRLLL